MTRSAELVAIQSWMGDVAYADRRMQEQAARLEREETDTIEIGSVFRSLEVRCDLLRECARLDRDRQALHSTMVHAAGVDIWSFHAPPLMRGCDPTDA